MVNVELVIIGGPMTKNAKKENVIDILPKTMKKQKYTIPTPVNSIGVENTSKE